MGELTVEQIRRIERFASLAWPAEEQEYFGGWVLRATGGITRRANSVFPIGSPPGNLTHAIEHAVAFYRNRFLVPNFQVTKVSRPPTLDDALADFGFSKELRVQIQTAPVEALASISTDIEVINEQTPSQQWLATYAKGGGYDEYTLNTRHSIMKRIQDRKVFVRAVLDDNTMGVGIGVAREDLVGIFGLVTLEEFRRRGVASAINASIGKWAISNGVRISYLQVESKNSTALSFYGRLGFKTQYEYWYRMLKE